MKMEENMEKLKKEVEQMKMPEEMKQRIRNNCKQELEKEKENYNMERKDRNKGLKKTALAAASLVLCICLTGGTVLASNGKLQGFFKDITRWDGAVIGTSYEQATDEVEVTTEAVVDGVVEVSVKIKKINVAPYSFLDVLGLKEYQIVDSNGKVILEGEETEQAEIIDGMAKIRIPLEEIPSGEYILQITSLVGSAKADQPLGINGEWECEFVK